jgi:uncharacterized membrane protein YgcG
MECDGACTTPSNWTSVVIPGSKLGQYGQGLDFAVGPQGTSGVVLVRAPTQTYSGGMAYGTCASNCTVAGNWQVASLGIGSIDLSPSPAFSLAFDAQDRPRVVYHAAKGLLVYSECDGGCAAATTATSAWHPVTVTSNVPDQPQTRFAFALDPQGRPRIALHTGEPDTTTFYWCDSGCTNEASWQSVVIGTESSSALSMALDGQGNPHVAYYDPSARGIWYKWCSADCDSTNAQWQSTLLSDDDMSSADPFPPDPSCADSNVWTISGSPGVSLALDANGDPAIALDVVSLEACPSGVQSKGHAVFLRVPTETNAAGGGACSGGSSGGGSSGSDGGTSSGGSGSDAGPGDAPTPDAAQPDADAAQPDANADPCHTMTGAACTTCCNQQYSAGLRAFTTDVQTCDCGTSGPCASACATEFCAGKPTATGDACDTCIRNSLEQDAGGQCLASVASACEQNASCVAYLACATACAP